MFYLLVEKSDEIMATTTDNDDFVDETEIKHEIEEFGDLSETIFDDTKMCNNAEPLENALLAADPDKCGICGYENR